MENRGENSSKPEIGKGVVEFRNLEIKEMHDWVLCPISYCIFKNPVIAEDGHMYEHDSIFRWFTNCREGFTGIISPLTKEQLNSSKLVPCQLARQMVDMYLNLYPEKKANQYVSIFDIKTFMYYLYHSVMGCEHYMRNVESFSLEDVSFYQMQKCVKIIYNQGDPLLRKTLWEGFFKKIEDIHAPFKLEQPRRPNGFFCYEDESEEWDEGVVDDSTATTTSRTVPTDNLIGPTLSYYMENRDVILARLLRESLPRSMRPQAIRPRGYGEEEEVDNSPLVIETDTDTLTVIMATGEEEAVDGDMERLVQNMSQLTIEDTTAAISPISSNAQTPLPQLRVVGNTTGEVLREFASVVTAAAGIHPEVSNESMDPPPFYSEEAEMQEEMAERELEEGEIREEEEEDESFVHRPRIQSPQPHTFPRTTSRITPRHRLLQRNQSVVMHRRKTLLNCLCFHGNKKILECFLNFMPPITCTQIAEKYQYLLENFLKKNIKSEKIQKMEENEVEMLQNILILMLDKGIPYHHWTKDRTQTTLSFMFLTLDPYYPSFARVQKKIIQMPEFFQFPSIPTSSTLTPRQLFCDVLSNIQHMQMGLKVWDIYRKNHTIYLEDIWEFCVKHSEFNIWNLDDSNRNDLFQTLLTEFVKQRGSIPMDLVLIKSFSAFRLIHLFIEGYDIEEPEKMYEFPRHEHLLPPIIQEEVVFTSYKQTPRFSCTEPNEPSEPTLAKTWKLMQNSPGGRLKISRRNFSTNWLWDGYEGTISNKEDVAQLSPSMSMIGWLIHHYPAPVLLQYFLNNKEKGIDITRTEFTGLEYVQPIHLIFRYYQENEQVVELVEEMVRRGASLEVKTSHGWLPIHYACRYSIDFIPWLIENVKDAEKYLNEPLCIQPSLYTKRLTFNQHEHWNKNYYPLDIYEKNYLHEKSISDSYTRRLSYTMVSSGAKNGMENEATDKHKMPFIVDTPLTFHIGSSLHTETNNTNSTNKRKRKLRASISRLNIAL